MAKPKDRYNAWNPGLESEIPARLMSQVTLYCAENSHVDYASAKEAAEFCGMKPQEMVAFKTRRLLLHEVLIRVTADFCVPDGPSYEELGLNLRGMARRILDGHVLPDIDALERDFELLRGEVKENLGVILDRDVFKREAPTPQPDSRRLLSRLLGKKAPPQASGEAPEILALADWQDALKKSGSDLDRTCLMGLQAIVGGIVGRRGRLLADRDLIIRLTTNWVCNHYGSRHLGELIEPMLRQAAEAEGYRLLPFQKAPFVMNVKGASAAGKSTIRPLQRELAERLGIPWEDFALVSPDYWRKQMLDYKSLGDDYKYAAMLTGQELEIIDKKLDRYMEEKAARGEMPHLLIDRFRFDSFVSSPKQQADGRLLSRFGDTVFMFFMITPPADTVERAWKRGKETGRYKAVDDLLYHNIEAYTGMPQLFFAWVNKEKQKIHFEFLDNSVAFGERPKTAAFGWNGQLTVLDMNCMRRMNRYQKVNIDAKGPDDVFLPGSEPDDDDILTDCIEMIPEVTFVDPKSLKVMGRTRKGECIWQIDGFFERSGLAKASANQAVEAGGTPDEPSLNIAEESKFTIGAWGRN